MQQGRRKFIQTSVSAGSALLLSSLQNIAAALPVLHQNNKSAINILATNWGFSGTMDAYCSKVKNEGYDGIEIWWPGEKAAQDELFSCLKKYSLAVGFLVGGSHRNYQQHFEQFRKMIDGAIGNKVQRPLFINCHSGRDFFSYEENKSFIDYTTQLERQSGVLICHETHRSRMLFAAPVAKQYIVENPSLKLTFDVSHWCNVSESLLQDQPENVALALDRVEHIHARIGHPEGPQVNDPRAPEWEAAVKAHFEWWDKVMARKNEKGGSMTFLTEFGPPDYMPTTPYTKQPLGDQWNINVYMMKLLRQRYAS